MNISVLAQAPDPDAAARALKSLTSDWEVDLQPRALTAQELSRQPQKVIDPVAVATLVASIPSAALAVLDLADRIKKRRRAQQLINQAEQLQSRDDVKLYVEVAGSPIALASMQPDQLLELASAGDQPTDS